METLQWDPNWYRRTDRRKIWSKLVFLAHKNLMWQPSSKTVKERLKLRVNQLC